MPLDSMSSLPFVEWSSVGILVMVCVAGAVMAMMRDWGARDTSAASGFGAVLLCIALVAVIGCGAYNFGLALAKLTVHQEEFASTVPPER
jgi:hypothetical protein